MYNEKTIELVLKLYKEDKITTEEAITLINSQVNESNGGTITYPTPWILPYTPHPLEPYYTDKWTVTCSFDNNKTTTE